ncbi:MAG: TIGR03118 family protein [Blastocatellia bacterium]
MNGLSYVSFALQKGPENHDDQAGVGNGFVDIFSPGGTLMRQFAAQGTLNSPWGMVFAQSFGVFSNALLVGNFGDGTINAFDIDTGNFLGQLTDTRGLPIFIDGLWSLVFGNGGQGGNPNVLYFTAGPNSEADGLFGDLQPAQSNSGIVNP